MTPSLLRSAKEALGASNAELAAAIGATETHVRAIVNGRYNEWLRPDQRERLLAYARAVRDDVAEAVARLEIGA